MKNKFIRQLKTSRVALIISLIMLVTVLILTFTDRILEMMIPMIAIGVFFVSIASLGFSVFYVGVYQDKIKRIRGNQQYRKNQIRLQIGAEYLFYREFDECEKVINMMYGFERVYLHGALIGFKEGMKKQKSLYDIKDFLKKYNINFDIN